jgi:hypothetical protein
MFTNRPPRLSLADTMLRASSAPRTASSRVSDRIAACLCAGLLRRALGAARRMPRRQEWQKYQRSGEGGDIRLAWRMVWTPHGPALGLVGRGGRRPRHRRHGRRRLHSSHLRHPVGDSPDPLMRGPRLFCGARSCGSNPGSVAGHLRQIGYVWMRPLAVRIRGAPLGSHRHSETAGVGGPLAREFRRLCDLGSRA